MNVRRLQNYTYAQIKMWYRLHVLFHWPVDKICRVLNVSRAMVKYHLERFPQRRKAVLISRQRRFGPIK